MNVIYRPAESRFVKKLYNINERKRLASIKDQLHDGYGVTHHRVNLLTSIHRMYHVSSRLEANTVEPQLCSAFDSVQSSDLKHPVRTLLIRLIPCIRCFRDNRQMARDRHRQKLPMMSFHEADLWKSSEQASTKMPNIAWMYLAFLNICWYKACVRLSSYHERQSRLASSQVYRHFLLSRAVRCGECRGLRFWRNYVCTKYKTHLHLEKAASSGEFPIMKLHSE